MIQCTTNFVIQNRKNLPNVKIKKVYIIAEKIELYSNI